MTTSPCSANAGALPALSRRRFAAAVTAAPAALLAPTTALLGAIGRDDALHQLEREWRPAVAVADVEDRKRDEVAAEYDAVMPREPDEIVWREEDAELFGDYFKLRPDLDRGRPTARNFFDGYRTVETLEAVLKELRGLDYPAAASAKVKRGIARIEQILTAHGAWRQETHACWQSTGMHAAERDFDAASDRVADLRRRIAATPATSLTGIMVKVRVGSGCFGGAGDEIESSLRDLMDEDDRGSGETIAYSILADLAHLAARGTAIGGAHA